MRAEHAVGPLPDLFIIEPLQEPGELDRILLLQPAGLEGRNQDLAHQFRTGEVPGISDGRQVGGGGALGFPLPDVPGHHRGDLFRRQVRLQHLHKPQREAVRGGR